jgi:hypothetical protein
LIRHSAIVFTLKLPLGLAQLPEPTIMADASQADSTTVHLRVFSDQDGEVYLFCEPGDPRVKVARPVNEKSLEEAKAKLVEHARRVIQAEREEMEGGDEAHATPQQRANREIKAALEPQRLGFFKGALRMAGNIFLRLFQILVVLLMIVAVYKGVEYSQEHLPEALHVVVLVLYGVGLAFCIYLMVTEENLRRETKRIKFLFGPQGLLVLPSLTLIAAASVFASLTLTLHKHGLVALQECAGRPVAEGSLLDFYMWNFLKLVPLVKLNEVLKLNEPLCYSQKRVGLLILLFQALVVIPSINTVLYYWKNRKRLSARPFDFLYEPGWQPDDAEQSTPDIMT